MIRKLICITICLALSLSCYTVSFAENTDVKDYSREISILKSIGIIKAYEDDGYISELNLTRGEAAFMICNMLDFTINTTGFEKSNGTIDWSGAAVKCLQENGYIHSEATKSSILYCDYIVLLLRALGYESLANYSGGYPTGYMKVAVDLDITNRGYSENATITKGEAAELMLNALETRILEPNSIKKGELVYSSSGVALNEYLDIYEGTGVLTQNYLTAVDSASGCASGYVRIGNELYEVENDSEEFLGEVIDFYYKDDGVDKKLLWAESDYEKKIKIMSDDIDSYADFTYKYSYNDRTKSIKILPSADIIYNGKFVSSLQDELYVPTNGYVEIIDTGNNSGYDLIKITNYSTAVIEYYNKDTNVLYDKFKKEIFKTDEDYFVFIGTEEKPLPENLVTDDVVSYRRSLDGEYTVLELNEQTVTGEILSTNSEPDTISIANKTYEIGYDLLNSGLYNGRPGDSVKIHLDLFGKVAYMTLMEASTTLGYLIKYHYDSYGIEDNIRVRLLTSDNTIETYDLAERIKIDGFSYKKSADVASVLSMYPSGVLAYKFNQDGKINYIDTPTYNRDKENENTLSVLTTRAELSYKGVTSIFSDRVAVDSSTICFSVPSAMSTDMRLYEKITKNKFVSTVKYDIATYRFDAGHGAADVIVLYDDPHIKGVTLGAKIAAVENVVTSYDSTEDEVCKKLELKGTVSGEFYVNNDVNTDRVQEGDIVIFSTNSNGRISFIDIVYSAKDERVNSTALQGIYSLQSGYVYYNDGIYLSVVDNITGTEPSAEDMCLYRSDLYKIFMRDETARNYSYKAITGNDLLAYHNVGTNASKVIVVSKASEPVIIFAVE